MKFDSIQKQIHSHRKWVFWLSCVLFLVSFAVALVIASKGFTDKYMLHLFVIALLLYSFGVLKIIIRLRNERGISEFITYFPTVFFRKELMYWANANFLKIKKSQDKVVIEKIDKHPKKVIFANDEDKLYATTHNLLFKDKNWQDLSYIVDVDVSYIEGVPKVYKILRIYREEVFDPEE